MIPSGMGMWAYPDVGSHVFREEPLDFISLAQLAHVGPYAYDGDGADFYGVEGDSADCWLEMLRGPRIRDYRADIVIVWDKWRRLVIECDGHDWHDRTKQQAAYDRARDRDLLKLGFATIRFTGSEIFHSAERCATDAYACLLSLANVDEIALDSWRDGFDAGAPSFVRAENIGG